MSEHLIAIAPFLSRCPRVITLGVRAALGDYSRQERDLMLSAGCIFFPTPRFVKIFEAAGKSTFPTGFTYKVRKSRVIQEVLFQFLACPHPRTRIYFGHQKLSIPKDFSFPFLAMGPDKSDPALSVKDLRELDEFAFNYNPLIIQENREYEKRFRLVFVNYEFVGTEGTVSEEDGTRFFGNVSSGYRTGDSIVRACAKIVRSVGLNDITVEVAVGENGWFITEFTRPPVFCSTREGMVNRHGYIAGLIESGGL
jgi:hypothetical protein